MTAQLGVEGNSLVRPLTTDPTMVSSCDGACQSKFPQKLSRYKKPQARQRNQNRRVG